MNLKKKNTMVILKIKFKKKVNEFVYLYEMKMKMRKKKRSTVFPNIIIIKTKLQSIIYLIETEILDLLLQKVLSAE